MGGPVTISPGGEGKAGVTSAPTGTRIDLDGVAQRYQVGDTTVTALATVDLHGDEAAFVVILAGSWIVRQITTTTVPEVAVRMVLTAGTVLASVVLGVLG